jgi:hypothetical protein
LISGQTKGDIMQVATNESSSPARPEVEPISRRHRFDRIAVWLVGVLAIVAVTIGVLSDGGTRPGTPTPTTAEGSGPASVPVVPFSVDGTVVAEGTSSVDG